MSNLGVELFTLSKDQFKLYFDTLKRVRPEVRIEMFPEKKHVYVRAKDTSDTLMSELILNVEPKEMSFFEIPLESVLKLSPKNDVTFYDSGNRVILSNKDLTLKVVKIDPRVSKLADVKQFPDLPFIALVKLDKPMIERWSDYFKTADAKTGVIFTVKDNKLTITTKIGNEDDLDLPDIPCEGSDCKVKAPLEPLSDSFATQLYKTYDEVIVHLGADIPIQFDIRSALLTIRTIIAPMFMD